MQQLPIEAQSRWLKECTAHARRVKQQNAVSMQLFQQTITRVHATEARIAQSDQLLKELGYAVPHAARSDPNGVKHE